MDFANRLKTLMEEHNITQEQLARKIGYSQRAVSKWVKGQSEPCATAIFKCAQELGVSADFLLGLID